jgi:hypothetical protein
MMNKKCYWLDKFIDIYRFVGCKKVEGEKWKAIISPSTRIEADIMKS